nr:hypothetical protein CFP56_48129 [Quercus suber]
MNSFAMTNSSPKWHSLPWFFILFFLSATFLFISVTSSASQDTYYEYCSSTVAGSNSKEFPLPKLTFPRSHIGYYTGGDNLHTQNSYSYSPTFSNSVSLRTRAVHETDNPDLFKVDLSLTFRVSNIYYQDRHRRNSVTFKLQGYRSEPEGNLCAVGTGFTYSKEDYLLKLSAVLKLSNLTKSTNITSLITGTLESLSSDNKDSYFDPISMLLFPHQMNYKYSYVSDVSKDRCSSGSDHLPKGLSLSSLPTSSFCSIVTRAVNQFNLKYSGGCVSAKNCSNPLDKNIGYVPNLMSLSKIECSEDKERMRVLVQFANGSSIHYYRHFSANMALVGEGSWDESKNQLCIVACRFMGMDQSFSDAHLGDCSTMLSLRFPAVWSIRGASSIVGQLWSERSVNESAYFDNIMFQSGSNHMQGDAVVSGVKYEYSKIDLARKSCSNPAKTKGKVYPNAFSHEMRFDMSVKISEGKMGWGYSTPISVDNQLHQYSSYMESEEPANFNSSGPVNISYHIGLTTYSSNSTSSPFNTSLKLQESFEILAEGLYDAETGILCMVGCRTLDSNDYLDCEILVNFEFPSTNKRNSDPIKGTIQSTREKIDNLYFEVLNLTANAYYRDQTSIRRMDAEIIMVLISTTLSCVFVGLQLFHVKRHSHVLPFTSLVMLSILTLGYMIPLVLNFEALFLGNYRQQRIFLNSGGWIEANEVTVRMVGMVVFLFQFRLLHRTWSARRGEGNQKALWVAEKRVLFVVLPLCAAGASVAVIANWVNNENVAMVNSTLRTNARSYWHDLKSFASLVLDGFLLPQILLNLLLNTRERALSRAFYMGNTIVRLLPHTYDLYRAHNYFHQYDGSYIYANPGADFYSTAWDVVIPVGGLVFALTIFLQQRFGGRFILPRRFRDLEGYEKVLVQVHQTKPKWKL